MVKKSSLLCLSAIAFACSLYHPPAVGTKIENRGFCKEILEHDVGPSSLLEVLLKTRVEQDSGPIFREKVLSSIARTYSQKSWDGPRPYWPSIKMLSRFSKKTGDNMHRLYLTATNGWIVDLYDAYLQAYAPAVAADGSFTMVNPGIKVKCRYSRSESALDLDLVYRGIKAEVPYEILQVRAVFSDGSERAMFEIAGADDEVRFDPEELALKVLRKYRSNPKDYIGLRRIDLVHNHPGESLLLKFDSRKPSLINLDVSLEDVEMADAFQDLIGDVSVSVTALIGLRPGSITRSSYSPTGRF